MWIRLMLSCALLVWAGPGLAQQRLAPKIDATSLALGWIQGRFHMPITCLREDGSKIELEQAIVIRPAPQHGGRAMARATLFGVDLPDVSLCYNLAFPRLPDRRGVLFFTFRSHLRSDIGSADFRHAIKKGELTYHIQRGSLHEREIGGDDEPRIIDFEDGGGLLVLREVRRGSDGDKLLRAYARASEASAGKDRPLRALEIQISGPEGYSFTGYFFKDPKR